MQFTFDGSPLDTLVFFFECDDFFLGKLLIKEPEVSVLLGKDKQFFFSIEIVGFFLVTNPNAHHVF